MRVWQERAWNGPRHVLSGGGLIVELALPGAYRRPRFDRSGFITQVTEVKSGRRYCAYETNDGSLERGGAGICSEFGIFEALGYEETRPGEWFPKLGVGLLQKQSEEPYSFAGDYPLQPFHWTVHAETERITFETEPVECRGYAAGYKKTVSVLDSALRIEYELRNAGARPIHTCEYAHNFLSLDGLPVGTAYELELSFPLEVTLMEPDYSPVILRPAASGMRWNGTPEQEFYCRLGGMEGRSPVGWELRHAETGACVGEECDAPAAMLALWGTAHTVSPELFVELRLEPGETVRWTRTYRFG
ncbi:hypothetical protein [Gorillibacterium sp. sgz5001074]|uniref:hypothetical protein n=1 Tax=Gorillibacterium sp. sgz5001074 TaxID=3446695 RepID=UPI003F674001